MCNFAPRGGARATAASKRVPFQCGHFCAASAEPFPWRRFSGAVSVGPFRYRWHPSLPPATRYLCPQHNFPQGRHRFMEDRGDHSRYRLTHHQGNRRCSTEGTSSAPTRIVRVRRRRRASQHRRRLRGPTPGRQVAAGPRSPRRVPATAHRWRPRRAYTPRHPASTACRVRLPLHGDIGRHSFNSSSTTVPASRFGVGG